MKIGCVIGVLVALLGSTQKAIAQDVPDDVTEHPVTWLNEISGVAAVKDDRFLVIGDGEAEYYYSWPDGARHEVSNEDGNRVCDGESLDVGYGPEGEIIHLLLGEDLNRVYVMGPSVENRTIKLEQTFSEECGRGAEGLSVRWSEMDNKGGWAPEYPRSS